MKKSSLAIIAIAGVAICQTGNAYSTRIYNRGTIIVAANNGSPGGAQLPTASDVLSRQKNRKKQESKKAKAVQQNIDSKEALKERSQQQSQQQAGPHYINPPSYQSSPGVNTARIAPVSSVKKINPVSFKFRDYTALNTTGLENTPGTDKEPYAWDRLNVDYHFTDTISLGVLGQYYHTWFGDQNRPQINGQNGLTQSYSSYLGNTGLVFANSKIADLGKGFIIDGLLRYDLPTSEWSQAAGSPGEGWAGMGVSKSVGIVDFKYTELVRYYFQTRDTSNLTTPAVPATATALEKPGMRVQNKMVRLYSYADIGVNITKKLSFALEGGFINETYHADSATNRDEVIHNFIIFNPEIDFAFNDHFSLAVGVWDQPDMLALNTIYIPLAADTQNGGEGYLLTTIKF